MILHRSLPSFRRLPLRALAKLGWLAAIISGSLESLPLVAEETKFEIRPRQDANAASDMQAALNWQRRLLESRTVSGLSELKESAIAVPSTEPVERPPVTIGVCPEEAVVEGFAADRASAGVANPQVQAGATSGSDLRGSVVVTPAVPDRDREAETRPTLGSSAGALSFRVLPPPRVSAIDGWSAESAAVAATPPTVLNSSRRWLPVSAQIGGHDAEATVRPELSSGVTVTGPALDSPVSQAAFQAPAPTFTAPVSPVMPPMAGPTTSLSDGSTLVPTLPTSPPPANVMPPVMAPAPPLSTVSPAVPTLPYNPGSLPTYPPSGRFSAVHGEPFVTGPPCEFDAAYMVEPTCYMQSVASRDCAAPAPGYAPGYTGIPANIAPPTIMPGQIPGVYSQGNAGFRPLIGLGQENFNVQVGRGIIGQPVAYVVGQPLRNFLRYIFP